MSPTLSKNYDEVKKHFKEGDWVVGTDRHVGCSPVFDHDTPHPQPFSYLDENEPHQFRLATNEEIENAMLEK